MKRAVCCGVKLFGFVVLFDLALCQGHLPEEKKEFPVHTYRCFKLFKVNACCF